MIDLTGIAAAACCGGFLVSVYGAARAGRQASRTGRAEAVTLALILLAGLLVRIVLAATSLGYATDIGTFTAWADHAAEGLTNFYSPGYFADYPPGYIYVLWLIGKARVWLGLEFGSPAFLVLLKSPAILADLATVLVVWGFARRTGHAAPAALAALYAFNPAILLNSSIWGQVDSVLTLFVLAGVLLLNRRPIFSGGCWAAALLVKPQALLFGPLVLFWLIDRLVRHRDARAIGSCVALVVGAGAVFVAGILPFALHQPPRWIVEKYTSTLASYPYASVNAYNLFALLGANGAKIGKTWLFMPCAAWGVAFTAAILVFAALVTIRGRGDSTRFWYLAAFLPMAMFVLSTRMHERYLFPALAMTLAFFIASRDSRALWLFAGLGVTQFLNAAAVLQLSYRGEYYVPRADPMLRIISLANVLLAVLAIGVGYARYIRKQSAKP